MAGDLRGGWAAAAASTVDDDDESATAAYGWFLLAAVALSYVALLYSVVVSKLLPDTGHYVLDWVKHDTYYGLLLPCTAVITVLTVYLNWMGMKFFRHN